MFLTCDVCNDETIFDDQILFLFLIRVAGDELSGRFPCFCFGIRAGVWYGCSQVPLMMDLLMAYLVLGRGNVIT